MRSYKYLTISISIYARSAPVKRVIKLRVKIRVLARSSIIILVLYSSILLIVRDLLFELRY